ncbi:DUF659 family protein [Mycena indigotica]|uniref:DUF659 family protein n=1 Tax=Mycena indigotica TaxID=2126181 RepID=A0A8H6VTM6_9AGAR|nr:DUF659 family protein [Mycena indigotica]KAF7293507.1 DUF659 family protein [Mycena indigotica]
MPSQLLDPTTVSAFDIFEVLFFLEKQLPHLPTHLPVLDAATSKAHWLARICSQQATEASIWLASALLGKKATWVTYTFDGSTVRRKDGFYTLHGTDPHGRSYLIDMLRGYNTEAHTAKWISESIFPLIEEIGLANAAAVCSDNTNVTKLARRLPQERIPGLITLWDCVHHIHNMIKDITKLPQFARVTKITKAMIAHFSKSNKSTHLIHRARTDKGEVASELQKPGTTRFGSLWSTFVSVLPYLEIIQGFVRDGSIKFKNKAAQKLFHSRSTQGTGDFLSFKNAMETYIAIIGPMIRSLWSLEAAQARGSDVFVFWHSMAATLKHLLEQPTSTSGINITLARRVTTIFNRRFKEFFQHDFYFTAFCMDPRFPNNKFLAPEPEPVAAAQQSSSRPLPVPVAVRSSIEQYKSAFDRACDALHEILNQLLEQAEKNPDNAHPALKGLDPQYVAAQWYSQMCSFWTGQYPFDRPIEDGDARHWWEILFRHPLARFLALCVLKMFSITANSMADERTNSMVTWMNSPLRRAVSPGRQRAANPTFHPTVKFRKLDSGRISAVQALDRSAMDDEAEELEEDSEDGPDGDESESESGSEEDGDDEEITPEVEMDSDDEESSRLLKFVVDRAMNLASRGLRDLLTPEQLAPEVGAGSSSGIPIPDGSKTKVSSIDWAAIRKGHL